MYSDLLIPTHPLIPIVAELDRGYSAAMPQAEWVEVLVDCAGVQDLYTYRSPSELTIQPGDILSVPFGSQQIGAIAIRLLTELPSCLRLETIRAVEEVVSRGFFPTEYWSVIQQVAYYYQTSLMQVIRVALPLAYWGDRNAESASTQT